MHQTVPVVVQQQQQQQQQQQHLMAEHGPQHRMHASATPAGGAAVLAVPADREAVFLRAFTATPLVRWTLEKRGGDNDPRKPSSMANVERRWFVG